MSYFLVILWSTAGWFAVQNAKVLRLRYGSHNAAVWFWRLLAAFDIYMCLNVIIGPPPP